MNASAFHDEPIRTNGMEKISRRLYANDREYPYLNGPMCILALENPETLRRLQQTLDTSVDD